MRRAGVVAGGGPDASAVALLGRLQSDHPDRSAAPTSVSHSSRYSNGQASWQTSRFTPVLMKPRRSHIHCRNRCSLGLIPSAKISATFLGEATGIGKSS